MLMLEKKNKMQSYKKKLILADEKFLEFYYFE